MTSNQTSLAKFQGLLRELFQFDQADLDFGIYRIMNHKRDVVEQFITDQLPTFVADELGRGPLAQQAQAEAPRSFESTPNFDYSSLGLPHLFPQFLGRSRDSR